MSRSWLRSSGARQFPSKLLRGFEKIALALFHTAPYQQRSQRPGLPLYVVRGPGLRESVFQSAL